MQPILKFICTCVLIAASSLTARSVVAQDTCEDLWFARNFYFAKNGYCFSSNLGRHVFADFDCKTKQPNLTIAEKQEVREIRKWETRLQCDINTSRVRNLEVPSLQSRKALKFQPINDGAESSCNGYTGPDIPIYDQPDLGARVIGVLQTGQDIAHNHLSPKSIGAGWDYVLINVYGVKPVYGWLNFKSLNTNPESLCESYAG